ncbi:50S ribosomal protein L22 [candidate division TM6 bacterium RIFCSPHIGHO2_12_FULL_36_22]|nr:MAG: 50S ribosomal protein L22 [candidate division TM6 bacterium RIFCSPHIGHO2_12_FULL_36_22]
MEYNAKARYIRVSPYKLRPVVDVIRGKNVDYALNWLSVQALKKVVPLKKVLESAVANAKDRSDLRPFDLLIKEVKVDQGPVFKYFKPGSKGAAKVQRKRLSHISITLTKKEA